jgi:hypothetical protein
LRPVIEVTDSFAGSTSVCSKTFNACQIPSTDSAATSGVNGTGMPPCGKNGLNRTHGSGPREVTSMTVASGNAARTDSGFRRRLAT